MLSTFAHLLANQSANYRSQGCRPEGGPHRRITAERPIAHLEGFKGTLQVDGYAGYRKLAERGDVKLAFCWAHMRCNFYELATPGPAPLPARR
jgi:hypothetical protein